MPILTVRRMAVPAAVLIAAGGLVGLTSGSAAADDPGVPIAGSHPAWASAANDAGAAPAAEPVLGQIVLKLRDRAGAQQLALAVATPGSAAYRRYVTPRQWIDRFSPDAARYASLVARLRRQGLTITGTPESRLYVTFTGTADQVAAAFDTPLHRYRRHGSVSTAPVASAKLPASIAADVSSLDISEPVAHLHPASYQPGAPAPGGSTSARTGPAYDKPCSSYYGQYNERVPAAYGQRSFPTVLCGYEPKQIRSAYGVDGLLAKGIDGRGLTIAFTDAFASPTLRADVNTFSAARGEPAVSLQQIVPDPSDYAEYDACGGEAGWQVEQTLDAVALHDIAPKASLLYVGAADCDAGFEVALSTILDRRLADVVSNSWGAPDALVNGDGFVPGQVEAIGNLSLQAAAEGIGLYFCSGDEGDGTDLDGVTAPWFPASLPLVTAVGGTSVGIDAKGKVALETGWGPTFDAIVPDADGNIGYVDRCRGRSSSVGPAAGRALWPPSRRTRRMSCPRGCPVASELSPTSRPSPTATPACSSASATSTPAVRRHRPAAMWRSLWVAPRSRLLSSLLWPPCPSRAAGRRSDSSTPRCTPSPGRTSTSRGTSCRLLRGLAWSTALATGRPTC